MSRTKPFAWSLDLTEGQIAAAMDLIEGCTGLCGTWCRLCSRTANVLDGHDWLCPACGGLNNAMTGTKLHEQPDLGPTAATIRRGIHKSRRWIGWVEAHYA